MKLVYKTLLAILVVLFCVAFSCRFSFWGPHRLVTEPWFLEGGELPAYVLDRYSRSTSIANDHNFAMHSCYLDDYLDAAIGLFLLPKRCETGEYPGEFGGLRMQRVLDAQNRWWRKIEDVSLFDAPVMLLYFLGFAYLFVGLAGLLLIHRNRALQRESGNQR